MKRIKNILYVIGAIVLIITIFFDDELPKKLDNILWILSGVLLLAIIILEAFFRKKK